MKKITDFIVEHRNAILVLFIILSGISLYISTKVNINYDIAKYLPKTSETRIGMDIMNDKFPEIEESTLNIMFKDLSEEDKKKTLEELKSIKNVSSVDYEETEDYNKDGYTLYVLNVNAVSDSKTAEEIFTDIQEKYENQEVYFSGSIANSNQEVLNIWVILLAIVAAMIILIIMCESYVEPFLFLFSILLGVCLNMGSNVMFDSVSNITNSIAAILQMALSMDYSIMLMNRYSQEREKEKNKVKAMKRALYNAFLSISSSSVTTIVGLLALVFMSFTIGKDLGFVLAKGVLFSLICIFTCLPGLIVLCDSIINKTKKKSLNIKLDFLGKFSYNMRYIMPFVFIALFIGSYIIKGNLSIEYTGSENDKVGTVFEENNQMALIYKNEYENNVAELCQKLESDKNISSVLCYGNTINEALTYDELNEKLTDLGVDTSIDEYLLKIIYYNYYNKKNNTTLTLDQFVNFINSEIKNNKDMKGHINASTLNSIDTLKNFTTKNNINKKRSKKELSHILGIDSKTLDNLLIYYGVNKNNVKLSIGEFINFLNKDILTDKTYGSLIGEDVKKEIKSLESFTDEYFINKQMTSKELSSIFGIDDVSIKNLMLLNYLDEETNTKLTINEFITSIDALQKNTPYLNGLDLSSITALVPLAKNENGINNLKMNKEMLSKVFDSLAPSLVDTVYQAANLPDNYTMSPKEFMKLVLSKFSASLPLEQVAKLNLMDKIITNDQTKYTAKELSSVVGLDAKQVNKIYVLVDYIHGVEWKLSPRLLVSTIIANKDNEALKRLDKDTLSLLNLLNTVMTSVNNNSKYTAKELASMFDMKSSDIALLYSLYNYRYINGNVKISLKEFVDFMLNDVVNNKAFASYVDGKTKDKLLNIQEIMNGVIKKTKYSSSEIFAILSKLSDNLEEATVDLVYIYHGSQNKYDKKWTLTVEEIVNYLNDTILKDEKFNQFIDEDMKDKIISAKDSIKDAKELLKSDEYSRMIINTNYDLEGEETFKFVQSLKDELDSKDKEIYVIGDSPMAYDISNTFDDEMNLITILTMLAIFVVVAITFKSCLVPFILVLIIQCAVFFTMGVLSMLGGKVYFIALLIVQSILMGATIDYAIVYTSYYREHRNKYDIKESLIRAYNSSIHTILTSGAVLIIVTLIVGNFASAIAAKICTTISEGTLCSVLLILFVLPALLAICDRFICKEQYKK
ncbi:MAG: efflux RND transporter permease subunit [Bacilli bacterium]|nr:efflux RND transporter permease subunit [Bacilli bacterium]